MSGIIQGIGAPYSKCLIPQPRSEPPLFKSEIAYSKFLTLIDTSQTVAYNACLSELGWILETPAFKL